MNILFRERQTHRKAATQSQGSKVRTFNYDSRAGRRTTELKPFAGEIGFVKGNKLSKHIVRGLKHANRN